MANTFKRKTSRSIGALCQIGGTTSTNGYVVPAATQTTVIGLSLCNISAAEITVDVTHFDNTNSTYLAKGVPIPVGGTLIIVGGDQKLVLETGDSVLVTPSAATSVDAVMSILEIA
jgi:hypothetical protein